MKTFSYIAVLIVLTACAIKPEPIQFGKDACHQCKMTLMDPKFGAELVTKKGRIYIFDDVNCLMDYIKNNDISTESISHLLVIDFANPETLIDAGNAFYLMSDAIKSPMASQVAAFSSATSMNIFAAQWTNNQALSWKEVKEIF